MISADDPNNLRVLTHFPAGPGAELTDVEVCGEFIFTGMDNTTDRENGKVMIFRYDAKNNALVLLHSVTGQFLGL